MEDESIDAKQAYLREEIYTEGYDIKEFLDFLISIKGDLAVDLNEWTFPSLEKAVNSFKEKHLVKRTSFDSLSNDEFYFDPKNSDFTLCHKSEKSPLTDEILKFTVSSPEYVKTSFLERNYLNFLVCTEGADLAVRRRFSDFDWLFRSFTKIFPSLSIPPLPSKTMMTSTDEKFIAKRMRSLEV